MAHINRSNMPPGPSSVQPKKKTRRGQSLRAARSRATKKNASQVTRKNNGQFVKAVEAMPLVQGPVMRLADGSLQAAIQKGRTATTKELDIEAEKIVKDMAIVEEQSVKLATESSDREDQNGKQECESMPGSEEENVIEALDTPAVTEFQVESAGGIVSLLVEFKRMMEQNERNQERRHHENEDNEERRHRELCAIMTKQDDAGTSAFDCPGTKTQSSEESYEGSKETKKNGHYSSIADVDKSVPQAPGSFANINAKTLNSVDHSLDSLADSVDLLIYTLEKTSIHPSHSSSGIKPSNPDQSRWFRYHHDETASYVELCQFVPHVMKSYSIPREKVAIARLNVDGLHKCTAISGWNIPFPKDDVISNYIWTLQVEEICKTINHSLPVEIERDNGFPGRYHACHAEKQLIAWYLYENTFAKYEVHMESPYALPNQKIKISASRGALIIVSREICEDCKEFIKKVKEHFRISDHFHVESRTCPEDIFDRRQAQRVLDSCNESRTS